MLKIIPFPLLLQSILTLFWGLYHHLAMAQLESQKTAVYLLHGQGGDERLFNNFKLDTSCFTAIFIHLDTPPKGLSMRQYAELLAQKIDTTKPFHLVGVSLGGMLAAEMADFLNPKKVILISSAKNAAEIPGRYKLMRRLPLHKIYPGWLLRYSAFLAQRIVEPDRKKEGKTFDAMLKAKDPKFLKRTVPMLIYWNKKTVAPNIIHIHGDNDHTLPIKKIKADYTIKGGSHMMVLTRGAELSQLVNELLKQP